MMGLPFQPETTEQLKARFEKAMETVYDADAIMNESTDRPVLHREHVFDFEDGIRLIISKDKTMGRVYLHVSASCQSQKVMTETDMLNEILTKMEAIGPELEGKGIVQTTEGGIVHFVIPVDSEPAFSIPYQPGLN
jgi:hypothetical protein